MTDAVNALVFGDQQPALHAPVDLPAGQPCGEEVVTVDQPLAPIGPQSDRFVDLAWHTRPNQQRLRIRPPHCPGEARTPARKPALCAAEAPPQPRPSAAAPAWRPGRRGRWRRPAPRPAAHPPSVRYALGMLRAHVLLVDQRMHDRSSWRSNSRSARRAQLPDVSVGPRSRAIRLPATQSKRQVSSSAKPARPLAWNLSAAADIRRRWDTFE